MPRASALARVLRDPLLAGYPVENVTSLTDEEATKVHPKPSTLKTLIVENITSSLANEEELDNPWRP